MNIPGSRTLITPKPPKTKQGKDREAALTTLKLLSALEGWGLASNHKMPEELAKRLDNAVELLTKSLLQK